MTNAVPALSMRLADDLFAEQFGASFERYGFAVVTDHGIDDGLIADAWGQTRAFFALPEEVKRAYYLPGAGGQRGYTPFRTEIAKGAAHVDLKEFWHVGRDLPAGHRFAGDMPANVWPEEVAGFEAVMKALYAEFDRVGAALLDALARYLGLTPGWFDPAIGEGNSILRLLHYPPVTSPGDSIRAEAHEDVNLITLLLGAEEAGLEILDRDGSWLAIAPPNGGLAVNVGDMLQRLTNHKLPSTTHRVRNPDDDRRGVARYSMPFFLHPAPDFVLSTLPGCVDAAHPDRYPEPVSSHAFLHERLREIGLVKA